MDVFFFDQASFRTFKKPQKRVQDSLRSRLINAAKGHRAVNLAHRVRKSKRQLSALSILSAASSIATAEETEQPGSSTVNVFISSFADISEQIYYFEKRKNSASSLLDEIDGMILHCKIAEIPFPRGLENILNYGWNDFIKEVAYSKKQWPTAACKYICMQKRLTQNMAQGSLSPDDDEIENDKNRSKSASPREEVIEKITLKVEPQLVSTSSVKRKAKTIKVQEKSGLTKSIHSTGFTINFSISSKTCLDQGWIIKPYDENLAKLHWREVYTLMLEKIQAENAKIKLQKTNMMKYGFNKPVILLHYEEARTEPMTKLRKYIPMPEVLVLKDGKPQIPTIKVENPELHKLHYALNDGSAIIYYPSGNIAVCRSHSGLSCEGAFYTNIFTDSAIQPILLASFTPFGHGSIFLPGNKAMVLLLHEEGGLMINQQETTLKQWRWPRRGKLPEPIWIQVNDYITVRIFGQFSISFTYKWQYEFIRFPLSPLPDVVPPQSNEMGELQTDMEFSSAAAKLLMRMKGSRHKSRDGYKKIRTSRSYMRKHSSLSNSANYSEAPPTVNEITIQYLRQLHRRIKSIIDEWMAYYRSETGLSKYLPDRAIESDKRIHISQSAIDHLGSRAPLKGSIASRTDYIRFLSAPGWEKPRCLPRSCTFSRDLASYISREGSYNFLLASRRGSLSPIRIKHGLRFPRVWKDDKPWLHLPIPCPVALRSAMLGEGMKRCRCSTNKVPNVTDLEFDTLVKRSKQNNKQIIVVCVVSSQQLEPAQCERMIQELYVQKNRNRNQPCVECQSDSFRMVNYDISTANEYTGQSPALLVERHNVTPGMFLMYIGGKLLFADHIFNGYSNTIKDLKKQIVKTHDDYQRGRHLLYDFRFSSFESELPSTALGHGSWISQPDQGVRPKSEASIQPDTCIIQSSNRAATIQDFIAFSLSQRNICCDENTHDVAPVPLETLVKSCTLKPDQ